MAVNIERVEKRDIGKSFKSKKSEIPRHPDPKDHRCTSLSAMRDLRAKKLFACFVRCRIINRFILIQFNLFRQQVSDTADKRGDDGVKAVAVAEANAAEKRGDALPAVQEKAGLKFDFPEE